MEGKLLGAQWLIMEVLVRQRGTTTDTSDVWIRGRFETLWESEQRKYQEEILLMGSEVSRQAMVQSPIGSFLPSSSSVSLHFLQCMILHTRGKTG